MVNFVKAEAFAVKNAFHFSTVYCLIQPSRNSTGKEPECSLLSSQNPVVTILSQFNRFYILTLQEPLKYCFLT
jgi:hypothetical protein